MIRSVFASAALLTMIGVVGCGSDSSTTASPSAAAATTAPAVAPTTGSAASASPAAPGGGSTTNAVQIAGFAFKPATLTVPAGTSVTWTNNDTATHTVTGSGFDSGNLAPGATFSHTFATAGTVDYHCSIHSSMTATVTVT